MSRIKRTSVTFDEKSTKVLDSVGGRMCCENCQYGPDAHKCRHPSSSDHGFWKEIENETCFREKGVVNHA